MQSGSQPSTVEGRIEYLQFAGCFYAYSSNLALCFSFSTIVWPRTMGVQSMPESEMDRGRRVFRTLGMIGRIVVFVKSAAGCHCMANLL